MSVSGLSWDSSQRSEGSSRFVRFSEDFVVVDSVNKTLSRLGVLDVFDSQVDSFWVDISSNSLVDDNTDGVGSDVKDSTSFSVVRFVGHTLLDGTISFDIDDVTTFVDLHVGGHVDDSMLSERFGEHVTGSPSFTVSVSHVLWLFGGLKKKQMFKISFVEIHGS
jgi:hypothetical protein